MRIFWYFSSSYPKRKEILLCERALRAERRVELLSKPLLADVRAFAAAAALLIAVNFEISTLCFWIVRTRTLYHRLGNLTVRLQHRLLNRQRRRKFLRPSSRIEFALERCIHAKNRFYVIEPRAEVNGRGTVEASYIPEISKVGKTKQRGSESNQGIHVREKRRDWLLFNS